MPKLHMIYVYGFEVTNRTSCKRIDLFCKQYKKRREKLTAVRPNRIHRDWREYVLTARQEIQNTAPYRRNSRVFNALNWEPFSGSVERTA